MFIIAKINRIRFIITIENDHLVKASYQRALYSTIRPNYFFLNLLPIEFIFKAILYMYFSLQTYIFSYIKSINLHSSRNYVNITYIIIKRVFSEKKNKFKLILSWL